MEPHAYEIFCMLIRIGKANQAGSGKTLLGRVLRHKNVLMCGYGAFGLYMLCRFMVTKEDKTIDLTKNDNWFKIKLMVGGDANATNNKTAVSNRRFDEAIRQHQKNLGIKSCHKLHFGRAEMPSLLELMEVDPDYIRSLGNWDQHAYDKAYSGKMPLPSMRGSGGHATEKGLHFNIRGQVDPAKELEKQLFTFVEREDAKIRALPNYHTMTGAQTFLKVMKDLRRVILQDAAAMQLAGRNHVLFRTHPAFSHPLFIEFKAKMEVALEAAKNQDPLDLSIERVLPGVMQKLSNIHTEVRQGNSQVTHQLQTIHTRVGQVEDQMLTAPFLQGLFQNAASFAGQATMAPAVPYYRSLPLAGSQDRTHFVPPAVATRIGNKYPKPRLQYASTAEMYYDWHGGSAVEPIFPPGGIAKLNRDKGTSWRADYSSADNKRYSRLKFVVEQVIRRKDAYMAAVPQDADPLHHVLAFYESLVATKKECKTLTGLYNHLKMERAKESEE
jgi:hypothetical protein